MRRLAVLVDGLPMESNFDSAVGDRPPISDETVVLMDIFKALTGKDHPRPKQLQAWREKQRREALIKVKREQARAFNAQKQN